MTGSLSGDYRDALCVVCRLVGEHECGGLWGLLWTVLGAVQRLMGAWPRLGMLMGVERGQEVAMGYVMCAGCYAQATTRSC